MGKTRDLPFVCTWCVLAQSLHMMSYQRMHPCGKTFFMLGLVAVIAIGGDEEEFKDAEIQLEQRRASAEVHESMLDDSVGRKAHHHHHHHHYYHHHQVLQRERNAKLWQNE